MPRPAPAEHRQARQRHLQAHQPGRRLLARGREERHAHAYLRHRLRQQGGAGGAPRGARAGAPAGPPPHRPRPRPLQLPRGGPRLPVLPRQGHAPVERHGRLLARRARARRLRGDQHAGHPAPRALGAQRTLGELQGQHVLHRDRRAALRGEADELPRRPADLQEPPALLPRPAAAHGRARPRAPPRDERRAARPLPRALLHPGRRAHLLHAGAARGRGPRRAPLHAPHLRRLRFQRREDRAQHAAREEHRQRRGVGARRRQCSPRCWTARPGRTAGL